MGFSAEWLSLREPVDHAARDKMLALQAMRSAGQTPVIVDLGSGTGSTMRSVGELLERGADWHLVDHDAGLLAQAAETGGARVHTHVRDLTDLDALPLDAATLVTASALLDLCSLDWLERLAQRVSAHRLPFYAALSYDGVMDWSCTDRADPQIVAAFNRHQHGEKGFGPALGPDAAAAMGRIFTALGYVVREADSPWNLGPEHDRLQGMFLDGIADAAAQAGAACARDWLERRKAQIPQAVCRVGHRDLLALPPELASPAQFGSDTALPEGEDRNAVS
ncbi:MAG: class I SAM-dependent methyltransferase [Roseinatronobacter sp.]